MKRPSKADLQKRLAALEQKASPPEDETIVMAFVEAQGPNAGKVVERLYLTPGKPERWEKLEVPVPCASIRTAERQP